ncbi:hypothetical protein SAMN05443529_1391 [Desulfosporosinus hippei DSM 8344]|uniref:Uncharacterized protein n=1 Tax=Desulfosporosinus hippei DSM 8344 TaxID=1121419 RepID=A0A1G8KL01_9FIRM|nr:hypothetical protein SAMN05443529_1391 [Desulfosporosinus hippei DSM 8344]
MVKNEVLEFCESLIDNVTVIKGYLEFSAEKDSPRPYITKARAELEMLTRNLVNFMEQKCM